MPYFDEFDIRVLQLVFLEAMLQSLTKFASCQLMRVPQILSLLVGNILVFLT